MSLAISYHMKRKGKGMAKGGEAKAPPMPQIEDGKVCMHCGGAMMAEGGELADFDSADFDAGGFEGKEANETGANSGDELSDEGEEKRRKSALLGYLTRKSA